MKRTRVQMWRAPNGFLYAKMPTLLGGKKAVTVSVPPPLRKRVFLYYGRIEGTAPVHKGRA